MSTSRVCVIKCITRSWQKTIVMSVITNLKQLLISSGKPYNLLTTRKRDRRELEQDS